MTTLKRKTRKKMLNLVLQIKYAVTDIIQKEWKYEIENSTDIMNIYREDMKCRVWNWNASVPGIPMPNNCENHRVIKEFPWMFKMVWEGKRCELWPVSDPARNLGVGNLRTTSAYKCRGEEAKKNVGIHISSEVRWSQQHLAKKVDKCFHLSQAKLG